MISRSLGLSDSKRSLRSASFQFYSVLLNGFVRGAAERGLWRVDHDELGILDGRDPGDDDILDGGAVARIDPHTVDLDRA